MTSADGAARVHADLQLQVGDVRARLVGDGTSLRLETDDAGGLAAAVLDTASSLDVSSPRNALGEFAALLGGAGVRLDFVGEHGTVATIGPGRRSGVLRSLTGLQHVQFGPTRVVARTAIATSRHSHHVRAGVARFALRIGAVAAVAAAVLAAGHRHHPSNDNEGP